MEKFCYTKFVKHIKFSSLLILVIIFLIVGYLYFAYARIYNYIGEKKLSNPITPKTYLLGNTKSKVIIKYVALGDSLTAGVGSSNDNNTFPFIIAQKLVRNNNEVLLINLGEPGATTVEVISRQLSQAIKENPDYITLLIGINDMHNFQSLSRFQINFQFIVSELKERTHAKITVINIPYLGSDMLIYPPYNFIFELRTKQFNEIINKISLEKNVKYVDLYSQTNQLFKKNNRLYSSDQFHPSSEGYKLWGELINAD